MAASPPMTTGNKVRSEVRVASAHSACLGLTCLQAQYSSPSLVAVRATRMGRQLLRRWASQVLCRTCALTSPFTFANFWWKRHVWLVQHK